MNCINCDVELEEVLPGSEKDFQMKDALDMELRFGFGTYHDNGQGESNSARACFCSGCATVMWGFFPGIRKMMGVDK